MATEYNIDPNYTLRKVYLMWLIVLNPQEFATEHDLEPMQILSFRNVEHITWGEFELERAKLEKGYKDGDK